MKTHSSTFRKKSRAFTLVEAVVALGVISFSLVAVVNVLPAGLESQKQAVDQSFGTQALSRVATALKGVYRPTAQNASKRFLPPIDDLDVNESDKPKAVYFYILRTSKLTAAPEKETPSNPPPRDALAKVLVNQLGSANSLFPVHVSVAWPARAEYSATTGKWTKAEGSTSTFIYLTLPQ